MAEIFQVDSGSFQAIDVSGSLTIARNVIVDLSLAIVTGSFTSSYIAVGSNSTASWANTASVALFALASPGNGTTLFTASTYQITSSWSNNAITAAFSLTSTGAGTTLFTGSTYPITASWAQTSSWSQTASFALTSPGAGTTLFTASTYPITSSWAVTASFASQSLSSSYSTFAQILPAVLVTGSTYAITASFNTTSSYSLFAQTIPSVLVTSSLYQITSSWANNAQTGTMMIGLLTGSAPAYAPGVMFYDTASFCYSYFGENSGSTMQLGFESWIRVFNSSSNPIANGSPVYLSGSFNGTAQSWLAIADGTYTRHNVVGVSTVNIQTQSFGYITAFGRINGIPVAFPAGSPLWLSTTSSGSFQTTIPTGTSEKVLVGQALISASIGGAILIDIVPQSFGSTTSSFAPTSSYSLFAQNLPAVLVTGSTYAITASFNVTSSFSLQSYTSSFNITSSFSLQSYTASFLPNVTYNITTSAPNVSRAWAKFQTAGGALIASQSFNCNMRRLATGSYAVNFVSLMHDVNYVMIYSGQIGSGATLTGSNGFALTQATNGFTCSTANAAIAGTPADPSTGSFSVFGF